MACVTGVLLRSASKVNYSKQNVVPKGGVWTAFGDPCVLGVDLARDHKCGSDGADRLPPGRTKYILSEETLTAAKDYAVVNPAFAGHRDR
jgi:hypothetical protein